MLLSAGQVAQARDTLSRRADIARHQMICRLAAGDIDQAWRLVAAAAAEPAPLAADGGTLADLERLAAAACVALASGNAVAAARQATEMGRCARARGYTLEERTAARILAAIEAAESGSPLAPGDYPRLIWVSRQD